MAPGLVDFFNVNNEEETKHPAKQEEPTQLSKPAVAVVRDQVIRQPVHRKSLTNSGKIPTLNNKNSFSNDEEEMITDDVIVDEGQPNAPNIQSPNR